MATLLLILGILMILALIASSGLSMLFFYAYFNTHDAPASTYIMQRNSFIVCGIAAIIFLALAIFCFKQRKKLNHK